MSKSNNNLFMRLRLAVLCVLLPLAALAQDDFVVRDMRVEGLQRISEGTVFNYLPVRPGENFDTDDQGPGA